MRDWKDEIRKRIAVLNLDPAREAEIVDELAQHMEDRYAELLARGFTPEEASRAALSEVSESEILARDLPRVERQVTQEPVVLGTNQRGRGKLIADLWQDLRYGSRMLLKPGFALIAITTLALGIGVNTALFTVFDAFVLKPLPLKDPDSITTIEGQTREGKRSRLFSYLDYLDYRDRNTVFAGLVALNKSGSGNEMKPFSTFQSSGNAVRCPGRAGSVAGNCRAVWRYVVCRQPAHARDRSPPGVGRAESRCDLALFAAGWEADCNWCRARSGGRRGNIGTPGRGSDRHQPIRPADVLHRGGFPDSGRTVRLLGSGAARDQSRSDGRTAS